jgi:hypothetical protein
MFRSNTIRPSEPVTNRQQTQLKSSPLVVTTIFGPGGRSTSYSARFFAMNSRFPTENRLTFCTVVHSVGRTAWWPAVSDGPWVVEPVASREVV